MVLWEIEGAGAIAVAVDKCLGWRRRIEEQGRWERRCWQRGQMDRRGAMVKQQVESQLRRSTRMF